MSGEREQEILEELRKINQKLDQITERKGLTTPMKFIALVLGFTVIGPALLILLSVISKLFN